MKNIQLIREINPNCQSEMIKDLEVVQLFSGPFRQLVEVRLRSGAVLSKHKAKEPITVFCLAGTGVFTAGDDLQESQDLRAGTLITLDANVNHEVTAKPELHLIVTKFKDN